MIKITFPQSNAIEQKYLIVFGVHSNLQIELIKSQVPFGGKHKNRCWVFCSSRIDFQSVTMKMYFNIFFCFFSYSESFFFLFLFHCISWSVSKTHDDVEEEHYRWNHSNNEASYIGSFEFVFSVFSRWSCCNKWDKKHSKSISYWSSLLMKMQFLDFQCQLD